MDIFKLGQQILDLLECDEIWYVYCDLEKRIKRLMDSRGYSEEKTRNVIMNQMSEEEFNRVSVPLASGLMNTGKNAFIPPIQHPSLMTQRKYED